METMARVGSLRRPSSARRDNERVGTAIERNQTEGGPMMIWYIHTQNPYPATMITASTNVRNKNIDSSRFFVGKFAVSGMICGDESNIR
jgi:hypothetical protein